MRESWGRCDENGNAVYEDRGPRKMNTFDRVYSHHAPAFRADIRGRGYDPDPESAKDQETGTSSEPVFPAQRSVGEWEYVSALGTIIDAYLLRMEPKPRQNLDAVKHHIQMVALGVPQEAEALELGVTQQAISAARFRAIEQLRETIVRVETGGAVNYEALDRPTADQVIAAGFLWGFRRQGINIGYGTFVPSFVRRSK